MQGPDLPPPDELFDIDVWKYRWPSGAEKAELMYGVLIFSGQFDRRDVEVAERAYPGRRVTLNGCGGIEIHPAGDRAPQPLWFDDEVDSAALIRQMRDEERH